MTRFDRRTLFLGAAGLGLAACASGAGPAGGDETMGDPFLRDTGRGPDEVIPLWPGEAPGGEAVTVTEHYVERDNPYGLPDRAAHEVTRPALSLFRAPEPDGSAILLIPGGGYNYVVVEKEGWEGARHFNTMGSHVYVMTYRLPHQGWAAGPDTPLQDAQRAVRVIRSRAGRDGTDPARVLAMGFSAGGHLSGSLAQRFDAPVYDPVDEADALSARPDLSVLVYPVALMSGPFMHKGSRDNLIGPDPNPALEAAYDLATAPPATTPPTFLLHTLADTSVPVENSFAVARAYRAAGIPAVIHVFDKGVHGFGMRGIAGTPLAAWPGLVMDWAAAHGFRG